MHTDERVLVSQTNEIVQQTKYFKLSDETKQIRGNTFSSSDEIKTIHQTSQNDSSDETKFEMRSLSLEPYSINFDNYKTLKLMKIQKSTTDESRSTDGSTLCKVNKSTDGSTLCRVNKSTDGSINC